MARSLENTIRDTIRDLKSINEEKQEVLAEGKSPHHKDLIDAGYNMMHTEVQKGKPGGGKYGANTRAEREIWRDPDGHEIHIDAVGGERSQNRTVTAAVAHQHYWHVKDAIAANRK